MSVPAEKDKLAPPVDKLSVSGMDTIKKANQLEQHRIETYKKSVRLLIYIIVTLTAVAVVAGVAYILQVSRGSVEGLAFYWHIPLMYLLAVSSLSIALLKITSTFGQDNPKDTKTDGISSVVPTADIIKQCTDAIINTIKETKK